MKIRGLKEKCIDWYERILHKVEGDIWNTHFPGIINATIEKEGGDDDNYFMFITGTVTPSLDEGCRRRYNDGKDYFAIFTERFGLAMEAYSESNEQTENGFVQEHYFYLKGRCITDAKSNVIEIENSPFVYKDFEEFKRANCIPPDMTEQMILDDNNIWHVGGFKEWTYSI